ncbi:zinc finger, BED-type containing protein [Tanacetum coccineum]
MIQPEPEGSTHGYPLVSVEVLRFNTTAGNPVKKILLKLNLSDHRLFKDGGGAYPDAPYAFSLVDSSSRFVGEKVFHGLFMRERIREDLRNVLRQRMIIGDLLNMESTPQSKESTASKDVTHPCKRNANDVWWEFRIMADPNDPDKKAKQDRENVLRAKVNISNDETIDLDEMEDSFGNLKPSKSFGPIDRFAKLVDKGTSKQTNLSNAIRKEQMIAYKEYISNWWKSYGGSAPNLRMIAIRILSLTTSSSGCERIWRIFKGVHTKKRNRLEVAKMNNLVYVQGNANLMEHNKKRKARNHEILLGENASEAQEWIVEFDNAHWEADCWMLWVCR